MKNKKAAVVFLGLAMLAFVASGCVNQSKIKELENEIGRLNQVVQQKDAKTKSLTEQMQVKQKELDSSKSELRRVKIELDNVNDKLKTLTIPPATPSK